MSPHNHDSDPLTEILVCVRDLQTKMTILVGQDGTNGQMSEMREKVEEHEAFINRQQGAHGMLKYIWAFLMAAGGAIVGRYSK